MLRRRDIRDPLLFIAWMISAIALFGSLFFSEVLKYEPCTLCWYERMAMYPLFILLGMAVIRKDYSVSIYSIVFSFIGTVLSLYHYGIQKLPVLADFSISCGRTSCTEENINLFGFVTIPLLSFIAFLFIFIFSLYIWKKNKEVRWF